MVATALTVPHNAWDVVHLDWITGLPKSPDGSDAILVMIDSLTGMLHLAACKKEDDSRKTAEHFIHNVIRLHGLPQTVISDRDIRLRAHFWRALNQRLGVNLRFTTAHHPQTNGKCERANAVVTEVLSCICSWAGKDWAKHLDMAEFVIKHGESASGSGQLRTSYLERAGCGRIGRCHLQHHHAYTGRSRESAQEIRAGNAERTQGLTEVCCGGSCHVVD